MQKPKKKQGGIKHDQGKPRLSLIPKEAIWEIGNALTYGANKYGQFNFRKGISHSRLLDAAMRHITEHIAGEDVDPESGNTHISHALGSLAMLAWMIKHKPELDDRYNGDDDEI